MFTSFLAFTVDLVPVLRMPHSPQTLLSKSHLIDMMALFDADEEIINPQVRGLCHPLTVQSLLGKRETNNVDELE